MSDYMIEIKSKLEKLKTYIADVGKDGVVIAFSGGVDSSTLAAITYQVLGEKAVAVIAQSATYTFDEMVEAKKTAADIGIKLFTVETNELENPYFVKNPENRCYHCKKELLETLIEFANKYGFKVVFEGTNASDLGDHRPGFRAIKEIKNVYSPWMSNGFVKDEIRQIAKQLGLRVYDKAALACLASRIPFHVQITAKKLRRIEEAERTIKKLVPVKQLRVRDHNGLARIEVNKDERSIFCNSEVMDKIAKALKEVGFTYVTFDIEGYRAGSMLETEKST